MLEALSTPRNRYVTSVFVAICCATAAAAAVVGVVTFQLAVLICPPAILVGAVGSAVMFVRNRRRPERGHGSVG